MDDGVAVVVPAHNAAAFIVEAIDSVMAQTHPPAEIVVVDDGSTDETATMLEAFGDSLRVVRQARAGVAAARNAGARATKAKLLAFLDADDEWLPRKLELQVKAVATSPKVGLVHCGVENIDATGSVTGCDLAGMSGWVADELLLFRRPVILGGGSGPLVRRAAFETVGGFDQRLSTSADWDLYYRLARRYPVAFVPEVLVRYRLHDSNMHRDVRAMEHDMLLAYEKAFDGDPAVRPIRRRSYGRLHTVLAGCYFRAHDYPRFARHTLRALVLAPENLSQFAGFPRRTWRRLARRDTR